MRARCSLCEAVSLKLRDAQISVKQSTQRKPVSTLWQVEQAESCMQIHLRLSQNTSDLKRDALWYGGPRCSPEV